MIKLNRIHHIALICSDYAVSKSFYTNVLGLEIVRETYRTERDSYKLDLSVQGEIKLNYFRFPTLRHASPGLRHGD